MDAIKVLVVCGAGAGSSAILMINAQRALDSLHVKSDVETSALYMVSLHSPDIIISSETFVKKIEEELRGRKKPIITITNFASIQEITSKLKAALEDLGYIKQ